MLNKLVVIFLCAAVAFALPRPNPDDQKASSKIAIEEVSPATGDPCLLPKAPGICRAFLESFYFNIETHTCDTFIFTGCRGNDNNFPSLEDCQKTCRQHLSKSLENADAVVVNAETAVAKNSVVASTAAPTKAPIVDDDAIIIEAA